MLWTWDQINRLRDKLSRAKRAGEWLSSSEVHMVLELIAFWRRMTGQSGWHGPAEGKMPTLASIRQQGVRGVIVECTRLGCGNRRKLRLDELELPDTVVFVEIARHRGFRCHRCGCRQVQIVADHPSPLGPPPGGRLSKPPLT